MFDVLTSGPVRRRRRCDRRAGRGRSGTRNAWDWLEERVLLTAPPVTLVSANIAGTNSAAIGALFPSVSSNGQWVAFESGSFQGTVTPAPSDLVQGLTVQNDAPNVYLRNLATNTTICLSVDRQNTNTTGNDDSRYPIISANGNTVVFLSNATDLTANDNPSNNPLHKQNVFAWSRLTGQLTLVTVNYQGTGPANDPSTQSYGTAENIGISANGNYIVYDSQATDLVPNENNIKYTPNVYVFDLLTQKNILVSRDTAGTGIGNGSSVDPVISADGGTVAFDSLASNLDPSYSGPPLSNYQVYASTLNYTNDTVSSTKLASFNAAGTAAGNGTSIAPSLSSNGQVLAFQSSSTNLVSTPNGGSYNDVYVRNLATNTTQLVSIDQGGVATGNSSSFAPQISADGKHVLFYSLASDLTTNPVNSGTNVFERNLTTGTTQLVSINYQGTGSANDVSTLANQTFVNSSQQASGQISDNGQYVIFKSVATDLVPNFVQMSGGAPFGTDLYLRDTVAGTTTLISHQLGTTTTGGTGLSGYGDLTPDGLKLAFQSAFPTAPDNMVSNDTNGQTQLFYVNLAPPVATAIAATAGTPQSATVNTAFATALQARVTDQNGNPMSGVTVTFAAPTSGASGTFPGGLTSVTATTNASGLATAPTFTANGTTGSYTVTASVSGVATTAPFSLTNVAQTPTTPNAPVLSAASDTGVSHSDGITMHNGSAAATLIYNVTGVGPANGFVQLYDATNPANPIPLGNPVQASGGNATVILAGGTNLPLADGIHQIAAASEVTSGGPRSPLSTVTQITIWTSVTITGSNPANGTVVTALPGGVVKLTFSHPLAGLINGGPALGPSDPYGIFLLARGPAGTFTAPGTSTSTPGYYVGNLPLHSNATYTVNGNTSTITLTPTIPFSTDVYLVSITLSDFSDLAGNTLTDPSGGGYRSFLLQLPPVNNQALKVTSVTTYNGATVVANNAIAQPDTLAIAFNRPLYGPSVTTSNVQLLAKSGSTYTVAPSVPAYSPTTNTIYLTPTAQLHPGTVYLIRVAGKDTPSTPSSKYVSDDQGYGNPGFPLPSTFYDTFTVTTNPASPGTGPLKVATVTGGAPALLPAANVIWTKPMGYASIGFTEAVNLSTIGRYSVMLVPESLPPTVAPLAPNIPLNSSLAFNPNTNQLIVVPTALTGNNLLYVYSLQAFQGHDGAPLLNNAGLPAGISGNPPYYQTFELITGGSHVLVRANGPGTAGPPIAGSEALANSIALLGARRHALTTGQLVPVALTKWDRACFRVVDAGLAP